MRFKSLAVVSLAALALAGCQTTDEVCDEDVGQRFEEAMQGETQEVIIPGTQAHLVQEAGDRVFFGFNKHDLSAEARKVLENQAAWLKNYPDVQVTVEGHCDERGTVEYNLALGERRANSARKYLVALGVDANRLTTISYGKNKPVVLGSNEEAWALNRVAVTVVE